MAVRRDETERYDFDRGVWTRADFLSAPARTLKDQEAPSLPSLGRWVEGVPAPRHRWSFARWAGGSALVIFGTVLASLIILFAQMVDYAFGRGWSPLAAVGGFALIAAVIALVVKADQRLQAGEADEALLEDPHDRETCLVQVKIFQDGVVTGTDRGAAWFQGGCFLFSGHRTSFVLGGEDVTPKGRRHPPPGVGYPDIERLLPLRHPRRDVRLDFLPLVRDADEEGKAALRFERSLRDFKSGVQRSRLSRQYPPLALDPETKIPAVRTVRGRIVTCLALAALGISYFALGRPPALVGLALIFARAIIDPLLSPPSADTRYKLLRIQAEETNPPEPLLIRRSPISPGGGG